MSLYDVVGAFGAALIVGAYVLLQFERVNARGLFYSLMNALGAALILISLAIDFNMLAFIVESFWLVVSGIGIVKNLSRRGNPA